MTKLSTVKYKFRFEFNHTFVMLLYLAVILHMTLRHDNVCQDQPWPLPPYLCTTCALSHLLHFTATTVYKKNRVPLKNRLAWIRHWSCSKFRDNYPLGRHVTLECLRLKKAGLIRHTTSTNCEPVGINLGRCIPGEYHIKEGNYTASESRTPSSDQHQP